AVEAVRAACMAKQSQGVRSPLEQSDREEAIVEWLAKHGLDTAEAGMLADTQVTFESLELLVAAVPRPAMNAVLRWAAAGCAVRNLTSRVQDSASRISGLVKAVKGFTHMDQAHVAEPVDLRPSLGDTVSVLNSKAREKSVAVTLELDPALPSVSSYAGEFKPVHGNAMHIYLD